MTFKVITTFVYKKKNVSYYTNNTYKTEKVSNVTKSYNCSSDDISNVKMCNKYKITANN